MVVSAGAAAYPLKSLPSGISGAIRARLCHAVYRTCVLGIAPSDDVDGHETLCTHPDSVYIAPGNIECFRTSTINDIMVSLIRMRVHSMSTLHSPHILPTHSEPEPHPNLNSASSLPVRVVVVVHVMMKEQKNKVRAHTVRYYGFLHWIRLPELLADEPSTTP